MLIEVYISGGAILQERINFFVFHERLLGVSQSHDCDTLFYCLMKTVILSFLLVFRNHTLHEGGLYMDESQILRKALKTFIEVERNRLESDAKEKGVEFNIDDFIVEVVLVELASNS